MRFGGCAGVLCAVLRMTGVVWYVFEDERVKDRSAASVRYVICSLYSRPSVLIHPYKHLLDPGCRTAMFRPVGSAGITDRATSSACRLRCTAAKHTARWMIPDTRIC
ncbi:hypothetical protein C8Q77DRAFT_1108647 [Trametes polyzona]|nr:hypothetical protein C8Q77DRAFT_1108647 [Trametes polyzona]